MVAAPAPMPAVPVPVTPTPVAMMPAYLLGLHAADLLGRGDGGMRFASRWCACILVEGKRRERRRLRRRSEGDGSGGDTEGHLQKIPAFHERFPLLLSWTNCSSEFLPRELNAR